MGKKSSKHSMQITWKKNWTYENHIYGVPFTRFTFFHPFEKNLQRADQMLDIPLGAGDE